MTRVKVVLVAVMTIPLAGCVLSGTPKPVAATPAPPVTATPAPSPGPLSIPQTSVELPPPQPLNPDALTPAQPVETPAPAQVKPQGPSRPINHPPPVQPKPPEPAPQTETEQAPRPQIHEELTADAQKQLLESAHKHREDTRALMTGARPHTSDQRRTKAAIEQFLKQSTDAENGGDPRLADQLAERAYVLAKDLQNGK